MQMRSHVSHIIIPLCFPFRITPLRFQAECCRIQLNLGYNLFRFILCGCIFVFDDLYFVDLVVIGLVLCYLRLLYYFFSSGLNFYFLSTSQEIDWEEHLRYDLFSVE